MYNTVTIEGIEITYRISDGLIERMSDWSRYYELVNLGYLYDSPIEGSSNSYIDLNKI